MKRAKYKITGPFGLREVGEIINCFILAVDDDSGHVLVYHPPARDECGSIEICKYKHNKSREYLVSLYKDDAYINIGSESNKFHKFLKSLARSE
jgi:hypothetical protein